MPKVFVAYSRRDEPQVDRLVQALERPAESFRISIWYGKRELQPGTDTISAILSAIDAADVFLSCVSPALGALDGIFLSTEKERAIRRTGLEPSFRIVNVTFGAFEDVPAQFRQFPTHRVAADDTWFAAVDDLRERIVWG